MFVDMDDLSIAAACENYRPEMTALERRNPLFERDA